MRQFKDIKKMISQANTANYKDWARSKCTEVTSLTQLRAILLVAHSYLASANHTASVTYSLPDLKQALTLSGDIIAPFRQNQFPEIKDCAEAALMYCVAFEKAGVDPIKERRQAWEHLREVSSQLATRVLAAHQQATILKNIGLGG